MSDPKSQSLQLNLATLQRSDPRITQVIETAAHVTLYRFSKETNSWEKKDIEGSLFIVRRNAKPFFQFWVMNRLNTNDMVEDLGPDFQLQIAEPYLLYRNNKGEVNGIWFYNPDERSRISAKFQQIIEGTLPEPPREPPNVNPPRSSLMPTQLFPPQSQTKETKPKSAVLTKDELRAILKQLVEDEQFIDKVHLAYLNSI